MMDSGPGLGPRAVLAFIVTTVVAVAFVVCAVFTVVAAGRWAFTPHSTPWGMVRSGGLWVASFVLMQGWSFYLRRGCH